MNKTAKYLSSHGIPIRVHMGGLGTDTNNKKVNKYNITLLDGDTLQKNKVG